MEQANKKLEEAKEEEQKQYDAMKLRIQYLYENSTDNSIWSAILESNGLSDMLNRIEYATDLYKSDRELMTSYQNAVKKVEDWTMQLADEMDSLLALQDKYQSPAGGTENPHGRSLKNKKMPMRSSWQKHRSRRRTIKRQFPNRRQLSVHRRLRQRVPMPTPMTVEVLVPVVELQAIPI